MISPHETMQILCIIYVNPFSMVLIISRSIVTTFKKMMCPKIMGLHMGCQGIFWRNEATRYFSWYDYIQHDDKVIGISTDMIAYTDMIGISPDMITWCSFISIKDGSLSCSQASNSSHIVNNVSLKGFVEDRSLSCSRNSHSSQIVSVDTLEGWKIVMIMPLSMFLLVGC